MAGLSRSASESSSTGISGRDALARVGLAGSFLECLAGSRCFGPFAIGTIWVESGEEKSAAYSNLIPARSITSPHFLESDAINAANASGVPPAGSSPMAAKRAWNSPDWIALLIAALSLSTIGFGTPAGAMTPAQVGAE